MGRGIGGCGDEEKGEVERKGGGVIGGCGDEEKGEVERKGGGRDRRIEGEVETRRREKGRKKIEQDEEKWMEDKEERNLD